MPLWKISQVALANCRKPWMRSKNRLQQSVFAVEESAKGIVNVAEMSTDLTGSVGDIQKAADHNNEIADLLDTEVKRFSWSNGDCKSY